MFRRATELDIDQIEQIFKGAKARMAADKLEQWNDEDGYPNRQSAIDDVANGVMYVYQIGDIIAGIIAINDDFYDAYPQTPNPKTARAFHRVAVSADFLGQGIGQKLYAHAEQAIKQMGYTVAIVDTYSQNLKMNNLILKCGYQLVGEFSLFPELPNWVMYRKELD